MNQERSTPLPESGLRRRGQVRQRGQEAESVQPQDEEGGLEAGEFMIVVGIIPKFHHGEKPATASGWVPEVQAAPRGDLRPVPQRSSGVFG